MLFQTKYQFNTKVQALNDATETNLGQKRLLKEHLGQTGEWTDGPVRTKRVYIGTLCSAKQEKIEDNSSKCIKST